MYNTRPLRVTMGPEAWDAAVFLQVVPGQSARITAYSASHSFGHIGTYDHLRT